MEISVACSGLIFYSVVCRRLNNGVFSDASHLQTEELQMEEA